MSDSNKKEKMTNWFSISVLISVLKRVIISSIFGAYADRRLIQAALNPIEKGEYDFIQNIKPNKENEIWIDYVADVGDGFNSTYTVAYYLAQPSIFLNNTPLPRGEILIMGGDAVYPSATSKNYKSRLQEPYQGAFPDTDSPAANHPLIFILPGNHDWYDGLTLFLAKFCRGQREDGKGYRFEKTSWRLHQKRSYFAIKLPDNWWVWGIDTQLTEDIDQPQADYFKTIIKEEDKNAKHKIIICSSEPTWLCTDSKDEIGVCSFEKGINHIIFKIIKDTNSWPNAKIYAAISGDSHHYNRYKIDTDNTQFITAGGGGAFLHPTHNLNDNMRVKYGEDFINLRLAFCYPDKCKSRTLSLLNWKFWKTNWEFCIFLGSIYAVLAIILTMYHRDFFIQIDTSWNWFKTIATSIMTSLIFSVVALILLWIFYQYADKTASKKKRLFLSVTHTIFHLAWLLILISSLPFLLTWLSSILCMPVIIDWYPRSWLLLPLILSTILGGFVGGFIWGIYLIIASFVFSLHSNDAFSAMRLDSYKNFLRIKLQGDTMTIYPIGIDTPCRTWKKNNMAKDNDQNQSFWKPNMEVKLHLIEEPIEIKK